MKMMVKHVHVLLAVLVSIHSQCRFGRVDSASMYVNHNCHSSKGNYTQNSVYQKNLNLVLSTLTSQTSSFKFYNTTAGDEPSKVYGLFQCQNDITQEVCAECIRDGNKKLSEACVFVSEAIVWYQECMLRYANRSIFSVYELYPFTSLATEANVSNSAQFAALLIPTIKSLISAVASMTLPFATREANVTTYDKVYTLAECTPDIAGAGCNTCLRSASAELMSCCPWSIGAMVLMPSCQVRYEMTRFYNLEGEGPPPPSPAHTTPGKKIRAVVIVGSVVAAFAGTAMLCAVLWLFLNPNRVATTHHKLNEGNGVHKEFHFEDVELVQYDFGTLKVATQEFNVDNKLGEGGFGEVFKGTLINGQEIAIKRLGRKGGQGAEEFLTEARLVAKLQHKNLVKLIGFCSEKEERLLVYEFMPNGSLDGFLFDAVKRELLVWDTRHKIILGIGKGLQYLHEDSRLRIVHRDLKASNILLDKDMKPKIADFGIAKLFAEEQLLGNATQIIGTRGYMAPEYMLAGQYSFKSDVYSFGVIVLEIVSGQQNKVSLLLPDQEGLLLRAWRLWNEKRPFDLVDPTLHGSCSEIEVTKCIQIAILCVQERPEHRPTMGEVLLMLTGSIDLPPPSA